MTIPSYCLEWCDFNPKKLPTTKIGKCENSEHEDWQGDDNHDEELKLCMYYSDFYNHVVEMDKHHLTDDEQDDLWDEAITKKWKPNSEAYWCKDCIECLE